MMSLQLWLGYVNKKLRVNFGEHQLDYFWHLLGDTIMIELFSTSE